MTPLQGFNDPTAVAVNPYWHTAYVVNSAAAGSVSVISETGTSPTGTVTATIPVGHEPAAVAVDAPIGDDVGTSAPSSNNVYVANYRDGTVSVINRADVDGDPGVIATIGGFDFPDAVAVDPDTHNVYVVNSGNATVSVIDESGDADTGKITAIIPVGPAGAGGQFAVAVDPGHNVYVTNANNNTVSVIGDDGTVTATIDLPSVTGQLGLIYCEPNGVAVDPSTHLVYVTCAGLSSLLVIDETGDAQNGTITNDIHVESPAGPFEPPTGGVAVDPVTHDVYVPDAPGVAVIDPAGSVVAAVSLNNSSPDPQAVAVDPMGWWGWPTPSHNVFVVDDTYGTVSVISPEVSPQISGGYVLYATAGTPYSDQLPVTGSPSPTVTTSATPPPGLTLSPQGVLSGTPTTPGTYSFPVTASNILPPAVSPTYTVVVSDLAPTFNSTAAVAYVGRGFSYQIPVAGVPTPTVQETGQLPAGIVWSAANNTLSGTPAAGTAGSYPLQLRATNAAGMASTTFTLIVRVASPPPRPIPSPPGGGCGSHLCQ